MSSYRWACAWAGDMGLSAARTAVGSTLVSTSPTTLAP